MAILAIRLLALTGCRRGEIERLQWAEIDLEACCLRLSDTKEGKSSVLSARLLGGCCVQLLHVQSVSMSCSADQRMNTSKGLPKAWLRIVKSSDLSLTPHGLRHAYASVASDLGYT